MQNRIIRKALLAIAAGAIGALAVAAPALATTVSVGGGTWQYGVTVSNYSNYYHGSKAHRSSVDNSVAGLVRSGCVSSGQWSYASEVAAASGNNAYWSTDACA